jgi:hypothetical protein
VGKLKLERTVVNLPDVCPETPRDNDETPPKALHGEQNGICHEI